MSTPRVTELSCALTEGLDAASPLELVRMLACADAQLFTGSHGLPCAHELAPELARTASQVALALAHPRGRIVFGGCGTSGRVAHLLAAAYNARSGGGGVQRFHYLLAGGDAALLIPAESVEDSAEAGAGDLAAWEARCGAAPEDPLVLVGVSCGFSATYVAALLAAGLRRPRCFVAALGFNALPAVAAVAVPGAAVTFHAVLQALLAQPARAAVLNPVVGPEAVAGSSRMKGGSATWILCAAVCEEALALAACAAPAAAGGAPAPAPASPASMRRRLLQAEGVVRALYASSTAGLASLVQDGARARATPAAASAAAAAAADAADAGARDAYAPAPPATGRIFLLGAGLAGLWGCVDASEATDTYGSAFGDLRGFVARGWPAMAVREGAGDPEVPPELRGRGPRGEPPPGGPARASPCLGSFLRHVAPTLAPCDLVVALGLPSASAAASGGSVEESDAALLCEAVRAAHGKGAAVRYVFVEEEEEEEEEQQQQQQGGARASLREIVRLCSASAGAGAGGVLVRLWELLPPPPLPRVSAAAPWAASLALKLALNALSTGAHVLGRGVVLGNRMGNMMLTNHKLYLRAVGIVGEVAGVARRAAAGSVLRAVYGWDAREAVEAALAEDAEGTGASSLEHVARAAVVERVIPTALLLAVADREGRGLTVAAARGALASEPRVRLAAEALGLRV